MECARYVGRIYNLAAKGRVLVSSRQCSQLPSLHSSPPLNLAPCKVRASIQIFARPRPRRCPRPRPRLPIWHLAYSATNYSNSFPSTCPPALSSVMDMDHISFIQIIFLAFQIKCPCICYFLSRLVDLTITFACLTYG